MILGKLERFFFTGDRILCARNNLHASRKCRLATGHLVAKGTHHIRRRPDECDTGRLASFSKIGIFSQEAVPGVNCVHIGLESQRYNFIDPEIGIDRRFTLTDQIGLIRFVTME